VQAERFALACVSTLTDHAIDVEYRWGKHADWTPFTRRVGQDPATEHGLRSRLSSPSTARGFRVLRLPPTEPWP
jgi:hypothetical protein